MLEGEARLARRERRSTQRLFEELRGRGYDGAHDSVHRFVRAWRVERARAPAQAFIPLSFDPGEAYQFDWSHEAIELAGLPHTVMRASFDEIAGKGLARREELYPLLASLIRAEVTHRQSRSINYRIGSARLVCDGHIRRDRTRKRSLFASDRKVSVSPLMLQNTYSIWSGPKSSCSVRVQGTEHCLINILHEAHIGDRNIVCRRYLLVRVTARKVYRATFKAKGRVSSRTEGSPRPPTTAAATPGGLFRRAVRLGRGCRVRTRMMVAPIEARRSSEGRCPR